MTFTQAVSYLKSTSARGSKLGLDRVYQLMEALGSPQKQVPVIHIAGTNGKGSVGAMLASVLTAAGYRTGHFSSPALTGVQDYFRIDGREVTEEQLASVITKVAEIAEKMADLPTEFEILAAAAYTLFADERCQIAVIECCMGGDSDCTNVIDQPLLSIITNVQLDHCGFLGNTPAEIASHKAGIIKSGCPVVFGDCDTEKSACEVVETYAKSLSAPLDLVSGQQGTVTEYALNGSLYAFSGKNYRLSLNGTYQKTNADTVMHAIAQLRRQGIRIPEEAVSHGLSHTQWHGRFEVLHRDPLVIFDGAHNPHGIRQLQNGLDVYLKTQKCAALTGVMADKDYSGYPAMFADRFAHIFTVRPDNPRALDAQELAAVFAGGGIPSEAFSTVDDGTAAAISYAKSHKIPLIVFGSLYLYREFCEALRKNL